MSQDIFREQSTDTAWEWARARRQWFKTPAKDLLGGAFLSLPGLAVRFSAGNPNWVRATIEAVGTALIGAVMLPQFETVFWRIRRRGILLDERERRLTERETAPPPQAVVASPPPAAAAVDRPKAEVTFDCDNTGWARLRIRNAGAGGTFTVTLQLHGLTAGGVEGRQVYARWELGDGAHQRLGRGETRVIRLATTRQLAPGVRAWAVHRADADDIKGVELVELMEVTIVADPDLEEPCQLQILLDATGASAMARVGVDQPLFHRVPQRVADMRRLLVEVAEYVRNMRGGRGNARDAAWMAVTVHEKVADLLGQAFGPREIAVYGLKMKEAGAGDLREASAAFLLDRAQGMTEVEILRNFPLPITWVQFYERQPGWEWPEYDD